MTKTTLPSTDESNTPTTTAVVDQPAPVQYDHPKLEPIDDYEIFDVIDEILRTLVAEDREATFAEMMTFRDVGMDNTQKVNSQKFRMRKVIDFQGIAQTKDDRAAAAEIARMMREESAARVPDLREQAAKLVEEANELERRARDAQAKTEAMEKAVADLRKFAPPQNEQAYNIASRLISNSDFHKEMLLLESEIRSAEGVVAGLSPDQILHHCAGRFNRDRNHPCYPRKSTGSNHLDVNRAAYDRYVAELKAELPKMKERHEQLKKVYDDAMSEAREMYLDIYAR